MAAPSVNPLHDVAVSFTAPVSACDETIDWLRSEAESTLPALMALNPDDAEVNPLDDWKRAPIKLWRMNNAPGFVVRLGNPGPIEKVRWSTVRSGLLNGKLIKVWASPTYLNPSWPGGPPPSTQWGHLEVTLERIGWLGLRDNPERPPLGDDGLFATLSLNSKSFGHPTSGLAEFVRAALERATNSVPGISAST